MFETFSNAIEENSLKKKLSNSENDQNVANGLEQDVSCQAKSSSNASAPTSKDSICKINVVSLEALQVSDSSNNQKENVKSSEFSIKDPVLAYPDKPPGDKINGDQLEGKPLVAAARSCSSKPSKGN